MYWNEKPYHSLDYKMKRIYGHKIYKLALDGGMTCPNRDGTLGTDGCIFCSGGGSGEFAESLSAHVSVTEQIEAAKARVEKKMEKARPEASPEYPEGRYIAYFQSYTNTYAPTSHLRALFTVHCHTPRLPSARSNRASVRVKPHKTGLGGTGPADDSRGNSALHSSRLPAVRLQRRFSKTP